MRKVFLLVALAAVAALSFGCAFSDYPVIDPPANKSHGAIDCVTDDRTANNQQVFEPIFRNLVYKTGGSNFYPTSDGTLVDRHDAKAWGRFIGIHVFNTETKVFGSGGGHWAMGGVKDMPNGDRRIITWYRLATDGGWSCPASGLRGRYGAPEGTTQLHCGGDCSGWGPETVIIDSAPGYQWGANVVALTPARVAASYSTFSAMGGRGGEGRLAFTPITRRAGLAEFLNGGSLTVNYQGVSITARGELLEDGRVAVMIENMSNDQASYQAEQPVRIVVDPSNGLRTFEVTRNLPESVALAQFAIDAGLTDTTIQLGDFIPELGVQTPDIALNISGEVLQRHIDDAAAGNLDW